MYENIPAGTTDASADSILEHVQDALRGLQEWAQDTVRWAGYLTQYVNHSYDSILKRNVATQKLNPNPSNLDILNYLANLGEGKSDHKTEAFLDIMAAMRRSCMTHSCGDYCRRAYP